MTHRYSLRLVQLCAAVALIVGIMAQVPASQAGPFWQEVPRLDGVRIYFSEDNKELSPFDRSEQGLSRLTGLLTSLGAQIERLDWRRDIPADADLVVIAGPTKDLGDDQSARLWAYLKNGGALLILAEPLTTSTAPDGSTLIEYNKALQDGRGLFLLTWADYGVSARSDVVMERESTDRPVIDFVATGRRTNHPILAGVTGDLAFFGARSVIFDSSIQPFLATPLIFAGDDFYGETAYIDYLQVGEIAYTAGVDTAPNLLALAVAAEDTRSHSRIVVIGDRDFATNGGGLRTSPPNTAAFVFPANLQFLLQAIAWLVGADQTTTVPLALPTPMPTATPSPQPVATEEPPAEAS
ncbi:MAG: Gldg family protein [Aggregatilineaceae bacterium]